MHTPQVEARDPRAAVSIVVHRDWLTDEWVVTHYVLLGGGQLLEDGQQRLPAAMYGPHDVETAVSALWERLHSLC